MTDREARIAKNETIAREINEGIEESMSARSPGGYIRMLCECGRAECERMIAVSLAEYEDARHDGRRFVIVKEHLIPEVEVIVHETDRFVVVEKRDGTPKQVAEATDPRD